MTASEFFDLFRSDIASCNTATDSASLSWRIHLVFCAEANRQAGSKILSLSNSQFLSLILEFDAKWEELRQLISAQGFDFSLEPNGFRETIFFQVPDLKTFYEHTLKRKN